MRRATGRPSGRAVGLGGALALVAAGTWLVTGPLSPARDVAAPPPEASPTQVVHAYLDALDGHDCATARDLWADGAATTADAWCGDVRALDDVEVLDEVAGPSGQVRVPVTFELDWRAQRPDGGLPEGETSWGYVLVRGGPDQPWRIHDEGRP